LLKKIWHLCGSVKLTFYLLLFISLNLLTASFYVKAYPRVFGPLNNLLFQEWLRLYGKYQPEKIWWLLTLSVLLIAFGINIAVCTVDRLLALWSKRDQMGKGVLFLRTSPSLIHICFSIVLAGHFLSMVAGFNRSIDVIPGQIADLPSQDTISVLDRTCDDYDSPQIIRGYIKQCTVSVELETPFKKSPERIRFLDPLSWHGLSFHLVAEKKPGAPKMKIIIKKDPGVKFILGGFTAMVLLMLWYFPQMNKTTRGGK
jgi:hypothetical protein